MTVPVVGGTSPALLGRRVRELARTRGTAPALRELLGPAASTALPRAPHGFAVLPLENPGDRVETLRTYPLPGGSVTLVRVPPPGPGDRCAPSIDATALLWLRLGLAEGLLRGCVAHLGKRPSGDTTVLLLPPVKAQLAAAAAQQMELAAWLGTMPADGVPASRLRRPHDEVTENGRALLRLFGAYGFLGEGPGGVAHVSELLAEIHQETEEAR